MLDNLNIHCEKSLTDYYGARTGRRLTVHYTPTHGSCLNQAEIELSLITRQCLGADRILELRQLRARICAWDAAPTGGGRG